MLLYHNEALVQCCKGKTSWNVLIPWDFLLPSEYYPEVGERTVHPCPQYHGFLYHCNWIFLLAIALITHLIRLFVGNSKPQEISWMAFADLGKFWIRLKRTETWHARTLKTSKQTNNKQTGTIFSQGYTIVFRVIWIWVSVSILTGDTNSW